MREGKEEGKEARGRGRRRDICSGESDKWGLRLWGEGNGEAVWRWGEYGSLVLLVGERR